MNMNSLLSIKLANCPVPSIDKKKSGNNRKKPEILKNSLRNELAGLVNSYALKYLCGNLAFFDQMFYINFKSK